jgi:hypothetical protein
LPGLFGQISTHPAHALVSKILKLAKKVRFDVNTSVVHQFELIEHHHLTRRINFPQELGNFYPAHIDTSFEK